jgi:hypothetical protein
MDMCTSGQQNEFAEDLGIIQREVQGFREAHGTIRAGIEMQTYVHEELAKGNIVSVSFLDVSAGFDTVPHSYLLRKLQMIGYGEETLKWVSSYLKDRTTRVKIKNKNVKTSENPERSTPRGTREPFFLEGIYD